MSVYDLIVKRRTIRSFEQKPIAPDLLKKITNAGRLAPSGANLQPLEFLVITEQSLLGKVFATLKWAAYIAPAGDPPSDKRPTAYIIVLINTEIKKEKGEVDAAAAIENMILTALEEDVGACWLGSINRQEIRELFSIPDNYRIDSVVAFGYPSDFPVVEVADNSIKYWKDEKGVLHVPKRRLEDIVHFNKF
ncbi:MAG: nitroreductase family protein [bacterium]|nr:nitroreductase family protein [bacterium]